MTLKKIIASAAALLLLTVILQNTQVVVLKLLFWELSMSQIILITLTLLAGMGIGFALAKLPGSRAEKPKNGGTT